MELGSYLLGACAAFLVGLSKTGVPGVSLPAILLVTLAFSGVDKMSVGAMLPVLLVGDMMGVRYYRQHADWSKFRPPDIPPNFARFVGVLC